MNAMLMTASPRFRVCAQHNITSLIKALNSRISNIIPSFCTTYICKLTLCTTSTENSVTGQHTCVVVFLNYPIPSSQIFLQVRCFQTVQLHTEPVGCCFISNCMQLMTLKCLILVAFLWSGKRAVLCCRLDIHIYTYITNEEEQRKE